MTTRIAIPFALCLLLACAVVSAHAQPPPVPKLTERRLDRASYVELAKQWKAYIEKNGETAEALVNLGMAYDYSDEQEAAVVAARRAVEVEPDSPKALAFLGKMLASYLSDDDGALEALERCRAIAPDYEIGLTMLAAVHLRRGEFDEADAVFKTIFEQEVISRPLQDYAYNMLVGLPAGAVLVTAGDNDTFPPLALQAGMTFRHDVIIINRSLLNLPTYARAIFERHPTIEPDYDIDGHEVVLDEAGVPQVLANKLLEKMIDEGKGPLYLAASANHPYYGFSAELYVEGVNLRAVGKALPAEESARLFLNRYRLDSATDWSFPWSLYPVIPGLLRNYVASMIRIAGEEGIRAGTRTDLLARAAAIAEFHEMSDASQHIKAMQKK